MADNQLLVTLGLESKSFSQQVKGINSEIKSLEKEVTYLNKSTDGYANTLDGIKEKYALQQKQVEALSTKLQTQKSIVDKNKTALEEKKRSLEQLKDEYGDSSKEVQEAEKKMEKYREALIKAERNVSLTEAELESMNRTLATTKQQLDSKALVDFGNSMQSLGNKISSAGDKITGVGKALLPVSASVVAIGVSSIKTASEFEQAMKKVQAISKSSGNEFEEMSEKAREMGASTTFSATQSAEAMEYMALAGWDAQTIMKGLPSVLKLAEATATDLALTSDIVTDGMSSLGIEIEDLDRFVDQLATTTVNSNTNMTQLGEAILTVGGTAKVLAGGTTEMNTALGIFADNGVKGAEGGTALRNIILALTAPTNTASKEIQGLGLAVYDVEGNMRPLNDIFNDLNGILGDLTEGQKTEVLNSIFNKVDLKSVNALLSNSGDRFNDLSQAIDNSEGSASALAETMNDSTIGNIKEFQSKLEDLSITIGNELLPYVNDLIDKLGEAVEWFSDLDEGTKENVITFGGYAAILAPLIILFGGVVKGIGNIVGGFGKMAGALGTAGTAGTVAGSASATTTAVGGLSGSLGAVLETLGPIGLAIGAVVLAFKGVSTVLNKDSVPAINLFSKNAGVVTTKTDEFGNAVETTSVIISDATAEIVGAYVDLDKGARKSIDSLYLHNTTMTEELASSLLSSYATMGTSITEQLKQDKEKEMSLVKEYINNNSEAYAKGYQYELQNISTMYDEKIRQAEEKEAQINTIVQTALNENRGITEQEYAKILELQNGMKTQAVEALSTQAYESEVILERMKWDNERLTTEMVGEHIRAINTQRDEVVRIAEEECNAKIAEAVRMRETGQISSQLADDIIAEAIRQKEGVVGEAELTREQAFQKMYDMHGDIVKEVDTQTGEVKTFWDKMFKKWDDWSPTKKKFEADSVFTETTVFKSVIETEYKRGNAFDTLSATGRAITDSRASFHSSISSFDYANAIDLDDVSFDEYMTPNSRASQGLNETINYNSIPSSSSSNTEKLLQELINLTKQNSKVQEINIDNMNLMSQGDEERTLAQLKFLSAI